MKKYVKPELFYEQFELSRHIADCALEYKSEFQSAESCVAYTDPDFWGTEYPVFIAENAKCLEKYEGYCYTSGSNGMNTFTS